MEREITIVVTDEQARWIDERVAAGEFTSPADVARVALDTYLHGPADIPDDVLRQLIAESDADDRPDLDIEEAFAEVRAHIDEVTRRPAKA